MKLRNQLGFSYIKNMLKDQLFKTRELQFDNWLFGPGSFDKQAPGRSHGALVFKIAYSYSNTKRLQCENSLLECQSI